MQPISENNLTDGIKSFPVIIKGQLDDTDIKNNAIAVIAEINPEIRNDAIIFTGGIGENDPPTRENSCSDLDFFGIKIDKELNKTVRGKKCKISTPDSKVEVWVIPTNEELLIARDTLALISNK